MNRFIAMAFLLASTAFAQSWTMQSTLMSFPGTASTSGSFTMPAVDLDQDGDDDFLIVDPGLSPSAIVTVLRTPGGLLLGPLIPTASGVRLVAAGDIDGDGDPDFVTTNDAVISVLRNDGTGVQRTDHPAPAGATALWLRDFDGDGDLDILLGELLARLNDGLGNFTTALPFQIPKNLPQPAAPAASYADSGWGDFNGDGILDLVRSVAVQQGSENQTVYASTYLGSLSGQFTVRDTIQRLGLLHWRVGVGDFDGDGDDDLLLANGFDFIGTLAFYRNAANALTPWVDREAPFGDLTHIRIADLDQDGDDDVLSLWFYWSSTAAVTYGGPDAPTPSQSIGSLPSILFARGAAIGDFAGNTRRDVVLLGGSTLYDFINPTPLSHSQPNWSIEKISGDLQRATYGGSAAAPLRVRVKNLFTNQGVAGAGVVFSESAPGGANLAFNQAIGVTDSGGYAESNVLLGVPSSVAAPLGAATADVHADNTAGVSFTVERTGLIIETSVNGTTGEIRLREDYPAAYRPFLLAVDVPLPAPGYSTWMGYTSHTSIFAPEPTLSVLDGLGAFGPADPSVMTDANGTWSLIHHYPVAALAGATFVFETILYDFAQSFPDSFIFSNPVTVTF